MGQRTWEGRREVVGVLVVREQAAIEERRWPGGVVGTPRGSGEGVQRRDGVERPLGFCGEREVYCVEEGREEDVECVQEVGFGLQEEDLPVVQIALLWRAGDGEVQASVRGGCGPESRVVRLGEGEREVLAVRKGAEKLGGGDAQEAEDGVGGLAEAVQADGGVGEENGGEGGEGGCGCGGEEGRGGGGA